VLVGVGGTGGHLARLLARLLVHLRTHSLPVPSLCLIDPDRVEAHNIGRQAFSPLDIDKFKAETVARRWSRALGLEIEWINAPFDPTRHLPSASRAIVIDAVDHHLARQALAGACASTPHVLVSCGNHRDAGQVSVGNCGDVGEWERYLERTQQLERSQQVTLLPNAYLLFPELLQPEPLPAPRSCGLAVAQHEQDLFINEAVALVAAQYLHHLLLRQPIHSFLTFVHLGGMTAMKPIPITHENLQTYLRSSVA